MPQAEVDKLLASGYNSAVSISHRVPRVTRPISPPWWTNRARSRASPTSISSTAAVGAAILGKAAKPEAVADNAEREAAQAGCG